MNLSRLGLFLTTLLLLAAWHQQRPLCYEYHHTLVEGWDQGRVQTFQTDTVGASGNYTFEVCLRTTFRYPFQTLWLLVEQHWQDEVRTMRDTVVCEIIDSKGNPTGKGVSFFQSEHFVTNRLLRKGQTGTITVRHIMRRDMLPGISEVGIRIRKNDD